MKLYAPRWKLHESYPLCFPQSVGDFDIFDEESKAAARRRVELDKAEQSVKRSTADCGYEHNKWAVDADADGHRPAATLSGAEVRRATLHVVIPWSTHPPIRVLCCVTCVKFFSL